MKKIIIATTAAAFLLTPTFAQTSEAAQIETNQKQMVQYKAFYMGKWCKKLKFNFTPNINKPVEKPNTNQPTETPDVNQPSETPNTNQPTEKPEVNQPSETPNTNQPTEKPQTPNQENTNKEEQTSSNLSAYEQKVVELTNVERSKNGLAPLKIDENLSKVAREKSRDMSVNKYFDHTSPTYGSPFDMMKKYGITYRSAGENIAMGQRTPEEVVQAWMNSAGHRANILNGDYTHIGVGHISEGNYWTQQFIGK